MIRFGSRGSELALTQSRAVAEELKRRTGEDYEIEIFETRGDKILGKPLAKIGGKGLFTEELENALREGVIDVAVHSLKDLPVDDPDGLTVGATPERAAPHDVLVFDPEARDPEGGTIPLVGESRIGTSSPRRRSSLLALRPDLEIDDIRGNIDTRARKVADGDYQATILAAAGLGRIQLETPNLERCDLPLDRFTPAPGQGALGVQCREDDPRVRGALETIHDPVTGACVDAERQLLKSLGGGCSMPLGALVRPVGDEFRLQATLFSERRPDIGISVDLTGPDPQALGAEAAAQFNRFRGEPLDGRRIALLRPAGSDPEIARHLMFAGAAVEAVPVSEILPLFDAVEGLVGSPIRRLAFTSARGVERFLEQAAAYGLDLSEAQCFAGGPATARALEKSGIQSLAPDGGHGGGAALAALIQDRLTPADGGIVYPCAERRHPEFERDLAAAGFAVQPVPVYRTITLSGIEIPAADALVLTSPSAVEALQAGTTPQDPPRLIALGKTTADAIAQAGLTVAGVAATPTASALLELILHET